MGCGNYLREINGQHDYGDWVGRELKHIFASADGVDVSEILHPLRRLMRYADGIGFDIYDMMKEKVIETYGSTDFDMNMIFGTENNLNPEKSEKDTIDFNHWILKELGMASDYAKSGDVPHLDQLLRAIQRYTADDNVLTIYDDFCETKIDVLGEIKKIRAGNYEFLDSLVDKQLFNAVVCVNDNKIEDAISILKSVGVYVRYVSDGLFSLFKNIMAIPEIQNTDYRSASRVPVQ